MKNMNLLKKSKYIPIVLSALILSGCASDSKKVVDLNVSYIPNGTVSDNTNNARAQSQLAEAAASVNTSLQELSQIEIATHPDVSINKPMDPNITGMNKITSINWSGPVEGLLKQIANSADYQVRVLGKAPGIPVIVNVNEKNVTLATVLRDTTYQAAKQATISVYSDTKTIELRYHTT